jgi:anti-sigma factor ChrR (cupin superfamily)
MNEPIKLADLLTGGWEKLAFKPFAEGIEIYSILDGEPALALLKYQPGASVPRHLHTGLETICVLSGSQSDERGTYATGTVIANPAGTSHAVWSDDGCVVLIQWNKPVQFLD